MPLETAASWQELASKQVLDVVRRGLPPPTWDDCHKTEWEPVLVFYCDQNLCLESLRFLWAVREYRSNSSVSIAEQIIEEIIYGNPPLNLYFESSAPIDEWYKSDARSLNPHLFEQAAAEVHDSFYSTYQIFRAVVRATHDALR